MSTRLIVHAGMHKTGTSSIQDTLAAGLDDPSFQYLAFGGPNGSRAIRNAYAPSFSQAMGHISDDDRQRASRVQGIRFMTRALNALDDRRTGIASAEVISTLPEPTLVHLFGLLRLYREDLQVVAYLRRPRSYAESAYQQQLKRYMPVLERSPGAIRYREVWSKVERAAGESSLALWPFDRSRLAGGDVVVDFCQRLGIALDPGRVVRSNEGLSLPATQLLYLYRRARPTPQAADKLVVAALAELPGPAFRFHSSLADRVVATDPAEIDWAERRTGMDMSEDPGAGDATGIRQESDLERPSAEAVEWLAGRLGVATSSLGGPTAIGDGVARLGAAALRAARAAGTGPRGARMRPKDGARAPTLTPP